MILYLFLLGVYSQHTITSLSVTGSSLTYIENNLQHSIAFTPADVLSIKGTPIATTYKTNEIFKGNFQ